MRRFKVRYRPAAIVDLEEIYQYVFAASRDPGTARRYVDRILDRCQRIGRAPLLGRRRDDLEAGLRTVSFERRAVIAYLVEQDCVRVINVFHGGRDYEALYRSRSKTVD